MCQYRITSCRCCAFCIIIKPRNKWWHYRDNIILYQCWIIIENKKNTTMSEQFQNPIENSQKEAKLIPTNTQIHDHVIARLVIATSMESEWLRRVWICQRYNQNPYWKRTDNTMTKWNRTKGQRMIYKSLLQN